MSQVDIVIPEAFSGFFTPSRYKAYFGGRGSAKSHSAASAALVRGSEKPLRVGCFREVQLSIKDSIKQLLDDKIADHKMGDFYESIQNEIRGANGTNFIFGGLGKMTTDQIKSMEGVDIAIIEEAQTISARSLEILIPTIRKPGSELWFLWNPRHPTDPVDSRFRGKNPPSNSIIKRVGYEDNPFFPEELRIEMEYDRINNPERFGHIWMGDYEPMAHGALWNRSMLHSCRIDEPSCDMAKIIVAVDPAISANEDADENGIVVCGLGEDHRGYVLEDASVKGLPEKWGRTVVDMYDKWEADGIVAETNQGGEMVRHVIKTIRPNIPFYDVKSTRRKPERAIPIAALYSQGKISHVGVFDVLENQMCLMTHLDYEGEDSPDRLDACVHGFTHLFPKMTRKVQKHSLPVKANNKYSPHRWRR